MVQLRCIRLNKFISCCGFCSRRDADEFIRNKKVIVNNVVVQELGYQIDPHKDQVRIEGTILQIPSRKIYIAFNKPKKSDLYNERFKRSGVHI